MDLVIDCETCVMNGSAACQDCVVSFVVAREPDDAVVFDVSVFAAMRRLQRAGLVDDLYHQSAAGGRSLGATG